MEHGGSELKRRVIRALLFSLASGVSSYLPLVATQAHWVAGQPPAAAYIFWVGSGVNVAGLLILGWRYAPVILLNALPYQLLLDMPASISWAGTVDDMLQALISWWILHRIGRYAGSFDHTRIILALLLAALVAPLPGALVGTFGLIDDGSIPRSRYWMTVINWTFSAGTAILMLTPLLTAVWRRRAWLPRTWRGKPFVELSGWLAGSFGCGTLAFHTVMHSGQTNFAFLIFPFVIFAAVRLGPDGAAATLGFVMLSLHLTLLHHEHPMTPEFLEEKIWFLQAFYWVLAATGLVVAALARERREAENRLLVEHNRALEASWREECARLEALRYQINPHFLFNALNSIRATLPMESLVPREMITDLGDFLRSTLSHQSTGNLVPLMEEIHSLENYLAIEKRRFGDDLRVTLRIEPEAGETYVPLFLLQPLVENAIRHGFQTCAGQLQLHIVARLEDSQLQLQVANSGTWRQPSNDESRTGVGLENIRRRLSLLYGPPATLTRTLEDGWVRMTITLPPIS